MRVWRNAPVAILYRVGFIFNPASAPGPDSAVESVPSSMGYGGSVPRREQVMAAARLAYTVSAHNSSLVSFFSLSLPVAPSARRLARPAMRAAMKASPAPTDHCDCFYPAAPGENYRACCPPRQGYNCRSKLQPGSRTFLRGAVRLEPFQVLVAGLHDATGDRTFPPVCVWSRHRCILPTGSWGRS